MTIKQLEDNWRYFDEKSKKQQAKHLLSLGEEYIVHKVNKLHVVKMPKHFEVVNSESLVIKFFITEADALNYCLDFYDQSKPTEQIKLF